MKKKLITLLMSIVGVFTLAGLGACDPEDVFLSASVETSFSGSLGNSSSEFSSNSADTSSGSSLSSSMDSSADSSVETSMDTSVEFQHFFASRHLMKSINILRNYRLQFSLSFPFRKLPMGCIGLRPRSNQFIAVKFIKFFGIAYKKGVTENGFGRILVLLMV